MIEPATGTRAFYVGIIDLDGFKPVNDLYGHAIGDALLVEVGQRLRHVLAREHIVARLGGDEFSVIVSRAVGSTDVLSLGQAAIEALRRPFKVGEIDISISASGGFARFPDNGSSIAEIYERADHALYSAKSHSRGEVVIFGARHEAELDNAGRVEQTLRLSDLNKELFIVFQPQIDALTGHTAGFEALARWNSSRLGPVPPHIFITAAERCGMIETVTDILVRKTLQAMAVLPPSCASPSISPRGTWSASAPSSGSVRSLRTAGSSRPAGIRDYRDGHDDGFRCGPRGAVGAVGHGQPHRAG